MANSFLPEFTKAVLAADDAQNLEDLEHNLARLTDSDSEVRTETGQGLRGAGMLLMLSVL
jgi:hypothetical protein